MTNSRLIRQFISKMILLFLFTVGMLLFLYPFYINALNSFLDQKRIEIVQSQMKEESKKRQSELNKKNEAISKNGLAVGTVDFDVSNTKVSNDYYKKHYIGTINIPKIKVDIPLFDETNDSLLQVGATVVQGTSYPTGGKGTHSVIAAHSGLPNRELFTNLEELKIGDTFVLNVLGENLAYQVDRIKVVKPDNTESLKIHAEQDLVTLLTCTPYMINTDRLLVTGHRIPYTKTIAKEVTRSKKAGFSKEVAILIGTALAIVIILIIIARLIHRFLLSKNSFSLIIQLVDKQQVPQPNQTFILYSKNGKKPLKRGGVVYQKITDDQGFVLFDSLPGGSYMIKQRNAKSDVPLVILGKKKIKQLVPSCQRVFPGYDVTLNEDIVIIKL